MYFGRGEGFEVRSFRYSIFGKFSFVRDSYLFVLDISVFEFYNFYVVVILNFIVLNLGSSGGEF